MELENKKKIIVILVIIITVGIIVYFIYTNLNNNYTEFTGEVSINEEIVNKEETQVIEEKLITVHITGQVINEGIVNIAEGSRIIDAINAAGGTKQEADISKVNLAFIIEDGMKIYIPSINDKEVETYIYSDSGDNVVVNSKNGVTSKSKKEEKLMVNINTANEDELINLPGIGTAIATRIISYRKENGKFGSVEDIKNVSGIGDAKFNNIKGYICVK